MKNRTRFDQRTHDTLKNWKGRRSDWNEARRNHGEHHRHHHDRDWWHRHSYAVVWTDWGWWGWSDGWWYPAWGYDPSYSYYAYDEPIYGYGGLAPDDIVVNVQNELQRLGYYSYTVDGVIGPQTREALKRYQRDHDLSVTGAIDAETVRSLGLT